MAEGTVTLALEGQVPLKEFAEAISGFSNLVNSLSVEVAAGAQIDWTVEALEAGSALATARGVSDTPEVVERVIRAYLEIGEAKERGAQIPYSDRIRMAAARITSVLNHKITAVRFETADGEATIYSGAAAKPNRAVRKSFGAVTGRVQTLSNRGGPRFTLFDLLNDRAVSCYVEPGHDELMRGIWGKIATVQGWVTRDAHTGRPFSVRRISALATRTEVEPGSYRRAAGAVPVGLEAISAEAAVRRLRDG